MAMGAGGGVSGMKRDSQAPKLTIIGGRGDEVAFKLAINQFLGNSSIKIRPTLSLPALLCRVPSFFIHRIL